MRQPAGARTVAAMKPSARLPLLAAAALAVALPDAAAPSASAKYKECEFT